MEDRTVLMEPMAVMTMNDAAHPAEVTTHMTGLFLARTTADIEVTSTGAVNNMHSPAKTLPHLRFRMSESRFPVPGVLLPALKRDPARQSLSWFSKRQAREREATRIVLSEQDATATT